MGPARTFLPIIFRILEREVAQSPVSLTPLGICRPNGRTADARDDNGSECLQTLPGASSCEIMVGVDDQDLKMKQAILRCT